MKGNRKGGRKLDDQVTWALRNRGAADKQRDYGGRIVATVQCMRCEKGHGTMDTSGHDWAYWCDWHTSVRHVRCASESPTTHHVG